jgi:hypothetical protein
MADIGSLDRKHAVELMTRLEPLIKTGNIDALNLVDEISETLCPMGEICGIFVGQLKDYEFEAACETAGKIRKTLEV